MVAATGDDWLYSPVLLPSVVCGSSMFSVQSAIDHIRLFVMFRFGGLISCWCYYDVLMKILLR